MSAANANSVRRVRRRPRRDALLAFEAIAIEGGLLSPDWLARVAQCSAGGQSDVDYRILKGLNLRDEIGRSWRVAQALWTDFRAGDLAMPRIDGLPDIDRARSLSERFVQAFLRDVLAFRSLVKTEPIELGERRFPIGAAALEGLVPVVIGPVGYGLDAASVDFGDGNRRRSAFGVAQEYLNANQDAMWGLVCDGLALRILRDNASLTRPAWIEVDLARIFTESRFADFAALWLLAHESRFGRADAPAAECPLESWHVSCREEGTRAREHLRRGVEEALIELGRGFLAHVDNGPLRDALQRGPHDGGMTPEKFFQQLLRLVYRLIFLLTIEERGLLHPPETSEAVKSIYDGGYGLRRLRTRATRRSAHDRHYDLWEALKITLRGLAAGEPRLGLPALAGLFAPDQCPHLDTARLENRALLGAIFRLSWLRDDGGLARVNWRDMGPEELGSVYESLLELVPRIGHGGREFTFASRGEAKGNERKKTGSYYTPDSLVQVLLDSTLEPVIQQTIAAHPQNPAGALLLLTIVDPACGSGHFLLAAARRLAAHVARLSANGTPSAAEYRHALRLVVGHCIHGVDLNLMAIELCRVSLWMEAVEPGLPLSFLDSHIQHGNALLGTTPALMAKGIPDTAWEAIEGDEPKTAKFLKKRNKESRGGQQHLQGLWSSPALQSGATVAAAVAELEAAPDADVAALAAKRSRWDGILTSDAYLQQRFVADSWCAAFVWPKMSGPYADAGPTNDLWMRVRDGERVPQLTIETVAELADRYRFFHWHLQFPHVFANGGFDVVLGNPPWERVKLQEEEFFSSRNEEAANAIHSAARKKIIGELENSDPHLWDAWKKASRVAEAQSHFMRLSGRFPLCGKGDVNTYSLFSEHSTRIINKAGRAGFIVPSGLLTDETTSQFLRNLLEQRTLVSAFDFLNSATSAFFPGVGHRRFKFSLITISGSSLQESHIPEFVFFAERVAHLREEGRRVFLSQEDFKLFNPSSGTCPIFRSTIDMQIARKVYLCSSIMRSADHAIDPWEIKPLTLLHMSGDSDSFHQTAALKSRGYALHGVELVKESSRYIPVCEAKMIHIYNHRYGDFRDKPPDSENTSLPDVPLAKLQSANYEIEPRHWVPAADTEHSLARAQWHDTWLLSWRDIARSGDERTAIFSVIPRIACGNTLPILLLGTKTGRPKRLAACFQAMVSSLIFDHITRIKNGGTHLTFGLVEQLPVLPPDRFLAGLPRFGISRIDHFITQRVLELSYTSWSLAGYAQILGYDGPPFKWQDDRRAVLMAELDALFFLLFGLTESEVLYVLDSFNRLKLNESGVHGEYRTKRLVLEAYTAIVAASEAGRKYATQLDPPPADPRIAHREDLTARAVFASAAVPISIEHYPPIAAEDSSSSGHRRTGGTPLVEIMRAAIVGLLQQQERVNRDVLQQALHCIARPGSESRLPKDMVSRLRKANPLKVTAQAARAVVLQALDELVPGGIIERGANVVQRGPRFSDNSSSTLWSEADLGAVLAAAEKLTRDLRESSQNASASAPSRKLRGV